MLVHTCLFTCFLQVYICVYASSLPCKKKKWDKNRLRKDSEHQNFLLGLQACLVCSQGLLLPCLLLFPLPSPNSLATLLPRHEENILAWHKAGRWCPRASAWLSALAPRSGGSKKSHVQSESSSLSSNTLWGGPRFPSLGDSHNEW